MNRWHKYDRRQKLPHRAVTHSRHESQSHALRFVLFAVAVFSFLAIPRDGHAQTRGASPGMVVVRSGAYAPFYPSEPDERIRVASFLLDAVPVTNADFLEFVRQRPRWRRSQIARLFADEAYLAEWASDVSFGDRSRARHPVTRISWFAAAAYCRSVDKRLPSEAEWEYVALADERSRTGMTEARSVRRILAWYASPRRGTAEVGRGRANFYRVHDMHGLVWEWVSDFNATMVSADNRQDRDAQEQRFCGGASIGSADTANYAAFMRFAFRSSLEASYTVRNLGFRCARNLGESR